VRKAKAQEAYLHLGLMALCLAQHGWPFGASLTKILCLKQIPYAPAFSLESERQRSLRPHLPGFVLQGGDQGINRAAVAFHP